MCFRVWGIVLSVVRSVLCVCVCKAAGGWDNPCVCACACRSGYMCERPRVLVCLHSARLLLTSQSSGFCSLFSLSLCFLKLFCLSKTRTSLILSFSLLPLRSDFNSFYFFLPSWFLKSLFILMSGIVMPSTHYHAPWVHFPGGFECIHRKTWTTNKAPHK